MKFVATENGRTKTSPPPLSFSAVVGSGIRDPGWIKIRIQDKHPGSATLLLTKEIFFIYGIQQCFICRPADSTVSEDALGSKPGQLRLRH